IDSSFNKSAASPNLPSNTSGLLSGTLGSERSCWGFVLFLIPAPAHENSTPANHYPRFLINLSAVALIFANRYVRWQLS
ncbi:MAG: hypothetical protein ABFQ95_07870, partial [Pseudomonadota bacterium]